MKLVTDNLVDKLISAAKDSGRLRKNHNFHDEPGASVQRFCNAFEPGTYVRPHRHNRENGWEFFIALKGRAVVLTFTNEGQVIDRIKISPLGPVYGIEIPANTWHAIASLETGTVLFELKEGPYLPKSDKEFAQWSHMEGEADAGELVKWYEIAMPGDCYNKT